MGYNRVIDSLTMFTDIKNKEMRKQCYYLLPEEPEKEEGTCEGCPYGKHAPCIGFCLLKIVRELKIKV